MPRIVATVLVLAAVSHAAADCIDTLPEPGLGKFYSEGWGLDHRNTRFQPADRTTIDAANVVRLKLKWVYGLANDTPRSFPLLTEDTLFIGDSGRGLVALDRDSGCARWIFEHRGAIASAIVHRISGGRTTLLFAHRTQGIFAIDAVDGALLWHSSPGDNPVPMFSGTPLVHDDSVYVPISSLEITLALNPFYGCCRTSGGFAALASDTGETRWQLRTAPVAEVTGRHFLFVEENGPSGAPIWGAPTLDTDRGLVYFGTGQNYSRPASATSDAIFAVDVRDGSVRWVRQVTEGDAYNLACAVSSSHPNCPDPVGPDVDFGAPPILAITGNGRELLIVGQKSGAVFALDPDDGEVIWSRQAGRGGALGGIHWGMAVSEDLGLIFVPVSDVDPGAGTAPGPGEPRAGVHALDLTTGLPRWSHLRKPRCDDERRCWAGASAAITATSDLVFSGGLDGHIEAIDARTGKVLWSHDSWRDYQTVNGIAASGGAFDAHGPMIVDNLLVVSSGYATFGQRGGNALLVFEVVEP